MARFTEFDFGITRLTSMFHRDWPNDGNALDVVRIYLWSGQNPLAVHALRRDALWLVECLQPDRIETLWQAGTEGRSVFGREPKAPQKWMRAILEECDQWTRDRPDQQLGEADKCSGSALGFEIEETVEIFSRSGLKSHIAEALRDCVQNCTPDLGLRFLIRIISSEDLSISETQYATLLRLGADLGYGEFLVSEVEHLVDSDFD